MSLLDIFDIAGSAMAAQNVRLNTTASNLANAESVSSNMNETYRARHPVFASRLEQAFSLTGSTAAGRGVQVLGIIESTAPLNLKYEPDHPLANDEGYVAYPNVNIVAEMADMMSATRSFQLNVEILNSVKSLAERLLTMGQ